MSLAEWDNDLSVVAKEIETIRAAHSKARLTGNKALIARKIAIIQAQINLDRNLERLKKLTTRELLLLPREKTMLHWTQVYLERVQKFMALRSRLLTRGLWLKLIKTRLMGPDGRGAAEVDADDLVALSIRHANLQRTEKYLGDALVKLRQKRREHVARYEALGIADANTNASLSLATRLGSSPKDAMRSPELKALSSWVKTAAAPISSPAADEQRRNVEAKLADKTGGLMSLCRSMVMKGLRDPGSKAGGRAKDKFQAAMQLLDDLEDQTRQAYDQILASSPEESHPVFVSADAARAAAAAAAEKVGPTVD